MHVLGNETYDSAHVTQTIRRASRTEGWVLIEELRVTLPSLRLRRCHDLVRVQVLELAECLLKLLLGFFKLFPLIEELAKGFALLDALNAANRLARLQVEQVLRVEEEGERVCFVHRKFSTVRLDVVAES